MPFSRIQTPARIAGAELSAAMAGIGMRFAAEPASDPNIEDTLFFASEEGMDRGDLRVLSVLVTWFGVHHERVHADRLAGLVENGSPRVKAFWAGLATWKQADRRFAKLRRRSSGDRFDLLPVGTEFQVKRRGEDLRFQGGPLRVPAGVLRDRPEDVLPPEALARLHRGYSTRIQMGTGYRADCWAALERRPDLTAAELARRTYAAFATAWQVQRDFRLLRRATTRRTG